MRTTGAERKTRRSILAMLVMAALAIAPAKPVSAAAPALEPAPPEALREARSIVEQMQSSDRGPYSRLRWYCKDGTVHPPTPYACAERGGGRQHGEFSAERERLATFGYSVGTVFAALSWDEFFDPLRRNQRLRELPLERYMVEIDDGWVLRKARFYRGRVQVEDEEAAGSALLVRLLSDRQWVAANYLVARELVRTVPQAAANGGDDRTRTIRRQSQDLAERDPTFERLRIKIHTAPGPEDIGATRSWIEAARGRGAPPVLLELAQELASELDKLYGESSQSLLEANKRLERLEAAARILEVLDSASNDEPAAMVETRARALALTREAITESTDGAGNLALLGFTLVLERELSRLAFARLDAVSTRAELLELGRSLITAGYGVGLLSPREREALTSPITALRPSAAARSAPTRSYLRAVRNLRRSGAWGAATVRYSFAEPLARYSALDPRAQRFLDDLLRGSPLLPLAEVTRRLTADADSVAGVAHRIFGKSLSGALGLNPGVADGPLRPVSAAEAALASALARTDIAVLPETVSELQPVAGILTLAEGNLLSHIQMLARNLGIPNASLTPAVAGEVRRRAGQEVMLAVGTDGSVLLDAVTELPDSVREQLRTGRAQQASVKLDAPVPDLESTRPLVLEELSAALAGRIVGPKAANLGELARLFPGRVEAAIGLPFGIFFEQTSRGEDSPRRRLLAAYEAHRAERLDEAGLAAEVEAVRRQVEELAVASELAEELRALMRERFGTSTTSAPGPPGDGGFGVFVRSDTNVEDLPGFTGAGLNLTVPNVVGSDKVLAAIPRVWASAYSQRAMAWRSTILKRPEDVFTSVLLMKAVPSTKSGVMVTADLATREQGLTVACAWGVGGAVDGEAAETVVLRPDGSSLLVAEAKAPYQRRLRPEGGVEWIAAPAGEVLTEQERRALRELAAEVASKLEPTRNRSGEALPWDIEFGFVDGRLTLFQIRPLVERGEVLADRIVDSLVTARPTVPETIDLSTAVAPGPTGGRKGD